MNKKKLAIASLVLAICSIIPMIVGPNTLNGMLTFCLIGVGLAIAAVILGFIGKSASKGMGITGIVIGIISGLLLSFTIIGIAGMKNVTNCVDQGNGTSKCELYGQEVEIPNEYLTD